MIDMLLGTVFINKKIKKTYVPKSQKSRSLGSSPVVFETHSDAALHVNAVESPKDAADEEKAQLPCSVAKQNTSFGQLESWSQ